MWLTWPELTSRLCKAWMDAATYNLGSGQGFSVREVIETARRITGRPIPAAAGPGGRAIPLAIDCQLEQDPQRAGLVSPYSSLAEIVETAWRWHQNHPDGYPE
jgi:UDP-glucose 4-epimerase